MPEASYIRRCPICRQELPPSLRSVFCSERCRRIDLSRWLSEEYRVRGGEDQEEGTLIHSRDLVHDRDSGTGDDS